MATRADILRINSAEMHLIELAKQELSDSIQGIDFTDPYEAKRRIAPIWDALIRTYGITVSTIASEWYGLLREEARAPGAYLAALIEADEQKISRSLAGALTPAFEWADGKLIDVDADKVRVDTLSSLGSYLYQNLRGYGHDTMVRSVRQDPGRPYWARVTDGDGCAFCNIMASRGGVYESEESATRIRGGSDRYHDDCGCRATAFWRNSTRPEGYDPDALYAKYQAAREAAGSGSIEAIAAAMRELEGIH